MHNRPAKITTLDTHPHRLLVLVAATEDELADLIARAVAKGWDDSIPTGTDPESGLPSAWLTKLTSVDPASP